MKPVIALFVVLFSAQVAADCSDIEFEPALPSDIEAARVDTRMLQHRLQRLRALRAGAHRCRVGRRRKRLQPGWGAVCKPCQGSCRQLDGGAVRRVRDLITPESATHSAGRGLVTGVRHSPAPAILFGFGLAGRAPDDPA